MPDRLVTIARFRDLPEALIQLSKLESSGIEAELRDENMVRMNWGYSNFIGGIRLQVAEGDESEAQAILSAPTEPSMEIETKDGVEQFEQPRCPQCNSLNIENRDRNQGVRYAAILTWPVPVPRGAAEWHCSDCEARWEIVPGPGETLPADELDEEPPPIFAATTNKGKLLEFRHLATDLAIPVLPVPGQEKLPEVIEDGATFEANAAKKAVEYSHHLPGAIVFADDSGLEVAALGGAPGVHSARYAARSETHKPSDSDNNYKLLAELRAADATDRSARFVCVIAAARDGQLLQTFRGEADGEILASALGRHGFGYDPLFFVVEADKTFGEMKAAEKSKYSHRGAAFRKFLDWLSTQARSAVRD
ncbi:MAG: RdgB/HAM1 family non-canonical purine NTP pyrophosphatase [Terriglobales bacterium]